MTLREAKARLNELVEEAARGEQVVLMRGSKHVAAIVPISAEELELPPRLTDAQARRLWRQLAEERARGKTIVFKTVEETVEHLARLPRGAGRRGRARKTSGRPRR